MKKDMPAVKARKSTRPQSPPKFPWKSKAVGSRRPAKRRNFLKDILGFRWLKKAMVGKTQEESLDLLDQWILKKKALSLFF